MKKFLGKLLGFLLFTAVLYPALLFVWGQSMKPENKPNIPYVPGGLGNLHDRLKEVKQVENVDLLFLGSSHTYRGIDGRIFRRQGFTSFNLGSSSQTPLQTKILLERYLQRLHPKVVVYAVDPSIFSVDGVESAIDLNANDKKDYRNLLMALQLSNIQVYNTLVYATIMDRINTPDSFSKKPNMALDTYIAGGFVQRELRYFRHENHEPVSWPVKRYQVAAFKATLKLLRKSGATCVLAFPPITRSLYESYQNGAAFDSTMRHYAPYYNFNKILQLDDSLHFYDSEHLNSNGVPVFDDKLLQILTQEGFLK